jgi:hypothetical protein
LVESKTESLSVSQSSSFQSTVTVGAFGAARDSRPFMFAAVVLLERQKKKQKKQPKIEPQKFQLFSQGARFFFTLSLLVFVVIVQMEKMALVCFSTCLIYVLKVYFHGPKCVSLAFPGVSLRKTELCRMILTEHVYRRKYKIRQSRYKFSPERLYDGHMTLGGANQKTAFAVMCA